MSAFERQGLARRLAYCSKLPPGNSVAELKEWTFDCEKENGGGDVDADFDAEKRRRGGKIDVVIGADLFDPVNNELETRSFPNLLAATLSALPSMALIPSAPFFSTALAFAILKARIDFELMMVSLRSEWRCSLSCGLMNARK